MKQFDDQLRLAGQKVGYVCIFSETVESASANLTRLITTQTCGFEEGVDVWRKFLSSLLQTDLHLLNWAGTTFTLDEWRLILEKVNANL